MPLVPIIAGVAFVAGFAAWAISRRAERRSEADLGETTESSDRRTRVRIETGVVVALGLAVIGGLMFDAFDRGTRFGRFDETVARFGAARESSSSTVLLDAITSLGGTRVITALTVAVAAYALARTRSWWPAVYLTAVSVGQALVNNGIKIAVDRERPNISQLADWSGPSFPSGHSAAAAAVFAGIAFVLMQRQPIRVRRILTAFAVALAAGVAATRALLGVHWLTDIVAGVSVGWAWFLLVTTVMGDRVTVAFDQSHGLPPRHEIAA